MLFDDCVVLGLSVSDIRFVELYSPVKRLCLSAQHIILCLLLIERLRGFLEISFQAANNRFQLIFHTGQLVFEGPDFLFEVAPGVFMCALFL